MKVTAIVCCLLFCCCLGERDCIYGSRPFHDTRYRYSSLPYPNLQTKARSNANDGQPAKSPSEELSSGNDIGSAGRSSTTEDIGRREELRALFRRVSVLLKRRENALKDIKFMLELRRYAHSEREAAAKPAPPT